MTERLLTLREAAKLDWLPRRRRNSPPSIATFWRWINHGCYGIRLRATSVGATLCITESDLRAFFAEVARAREIRQ